MDAPTLTRFWKKVAVEPGGCWRWTGARYSNGYALVPQVVEGRRTTRLGHRLAYEHFVGPVPDGLDLDHLCRVRECVNPQHLEPVTRSENLLRSPLMGKAQSVKTHCKRGHPLDGDNVYLAANGARHCRACRGVKKREYLADPVRGAAMRAADAAAHRAARDAARGAPSQPNAIKTHCKQGHPFAGDNLVMQGGQRRCRLCMAAASQRAYQKRTRQE